MTGTLTIILSFASYAFVLLAMFRLFRINYFNPIVKIFATYLEPISKSIFFFLNPLLAALALAFLLQFVSLYLAYSSGYEPLTLLFISIINFSICMFDIRLGARTISSAFSLIDRLNVLLLLLIIL